MLPDFIKPENLAIINQLFYGLLAVIGLAFTYMAYSIVRRLFNAVHFVANIAYASPFLIGVVGLGAIGFGWADLLTGPQSQSTIAVKFLNKTKDDNERRELMNHISKNPSAFQFIAYPQSQMDPATPEPIMRPAYAGCLISLGVGCVLYCLASCAIRTQYKRW
jgi:hypothetical protein